MIYIQGDWIKEGAIVIDCGINVIPGISFTLFISDGSNLCLVTVSRDIIIPLCSSLRLRSHDADIILKCHKIVTNRRHGKLSRKIVHT